MIRRFNSLLITLLVVGAALYIVVLNRQSIDFYTSRGSAYSVTSGVLVLGSFAIGLLTASFFALLIGAKAQLREHRLKRKVRDQEGFYDEMIKARGAQAAGEWGNAIELWESAIRADPTDIIARIELSRCYENSGESRDALRVIDDARAREPNNIEVLYRAAELNSKLGNRTAALDNLVLILYQYPSKRAASMAASLSEELGRVEDALEYHAQLTSLGYESEDSVTAVDRLKFRQMVDSYNGDQQRLESELRNFVKRKEFAPALEKLAEIQVAKGRQEEAADLLLRAAKQSGKAALWHRVSKIWLEAGVPARALAAARSATHGTTGQSRINAETNLIRLQIAFGMLDEAKASLDSFEKTAKEAGVTPSLEDTRTVYHLRGLCLNRMGRANEAAEIWKKLSDYDYKFELQPTAKEVRENAPSPSLSTP